MQDADTDTDRVGCVDELLRESECGQCVGDLDCARVVLVEVCRTHNNNGNEVDPRLLLLATYRYSGCC